MIGRNDDDDDNNFRRATSQDNLFSLQEIRMGQESTGIPTPLLGGSDKLNADLVVPSDQLPAAPFVHARNRFPSSNSSQAHRTRELSSYASSNRASTDLTSIWGPMEALTIGSNTQSSATTAHAITSETTTIRSRANSEDMFSPSHFSEKFMLEGTDGSTRPHFTTTRRQEPESRLLKQPKKSNSSATLVDLALEPATAGSNSATSSHWISAQQHQLAVMPLAPAPLLKKSASMASLSFVERSFTLNSFPSNHKININHHTHNSSVNLSDARGGGLDYPSFRSAPHSREPTASSVDMYSTAPICRYFLQGYCSRGTRCFYSHNIKSSIPLHQPQLQQLSQSSITTATGNQLSAPPPSSHIRNLSVPTIGLNSQSHPLHPPLSLSVQSQLPTFEAKYQHHHHYQPSQQQQQQQQYQNQQHNLRINHSSQFQSFYPQSAPLPPSSTSGNKSSHSLNSINLSSQISAKHSSNSSAAASSGAKKSVATAEEDANRYANVNIEDLVGQYYSMCKDQFGCRYLQKQIEATPQKAISLLFQDIFDHVAELMTDPFGNYLCQKLLEFCDESQKGKIVARVSPSLVAICLNMHGTRAVQKLIENVTDVKHIQVMTDSLARDAVKLIKDLNGNHVIQKCLSKLSPAMNQFVFDAVSATIIEVATHRHGCCVLQRCIDHAVESQKLQLVQEIAANGLALVQDPFGNYVVQYVLDLEDECYSSYIVRPFIGNVCLLSVQKFSSNVIEKCIRVSNATLRRYLIEELLDRARLEALLRDSYANYVVQTALDYADAEQKQKLIECIKPILPVIRTTPYGKRIQTKLARSLAE